MAQNATFTPGGKNWRDYRSPQATEYMKGASLPYLNNTIKRALERTDWRHAMDEPEDKMAIKNSYAGEMTVRSNERPAPDIFKSDFQQAQLAPPPRRKRR